jgi:hypothetical protein
MLSSSGSWWRRKRVEKGKCPSSCIDRQGQAIQRTYHCFQVFTTPTPGTWYLVFHCREHHADTGFYLLPHPPSIRAA